MNKWIGVAGAAAIAICNARAYHHRSYVDVSWALIAAYAFSLWIWRDQRPRSLQRPATPWQGLFHAQWVAGGLYQFEPSPLGIVGGVLLRIVVLTALLSLFRERPLTGSGSP